MPEDNPLIWETQTYGYERSRNSFWYLTIGYLN
jgi:hypothetical protein